MYKQNFIFYSAIPNIAPTNVAQQIHGQHNTSQKSATVIPGIDKIAPIIINIAATAIMNNIAKTIMKNKIEK